MIIRSQIFLRFCERFEVRPDVTDFLLVFFMLLSCNGLFRVELLERLRPFFDSLPSLNQIRSCFGDCEIMVDWAGLDCEMLVSCSGEVTTGVACPFKWTSFVFLGLRVLGQIQIVLLLDSLVFRLALCRYQR